MHFSKPRAFSMSMMLYVDDDWDLCELIGLMLKMASDGYEVTAVSNAWKVFDLMEDQQITPFILDYALPETTGVKLCRRIRQAYLQPPILFTRRWSATEYLVKPNDLERFIETVQRLLSQNSKISEQRVFD